MVWDLSSPTGAQPVSSVDDYIREFKTDVQAALRGQQADGIIGSFPGTNTALPVYHYRGQIGSTVARPASGGNGLYFDTTRQTLQRDNGTTWDDVGTNIPAGTVMPFYQASAPTGWTKITTQDDKALRVVAGSTGGSAGGSLPLSGGVSHTHTVAAHNHTIPSTSVDHKHYTAVVYSTASGQLNGVAENPFGKGGDASAYNQGTFASRVGGQGSSQFQTTDVMTGYANGGTGLTALTSDAAAPVIAYCDVILCSKA